MFAFLEFVFAVSVGLVVFLLLYALLQKQVRPQVEVQKRITQLRVNPLIERQQEQRILAGGQKKRKSRAILSKEQKDFVERTVKPIVEGLGDRLMRLTPKELLQKIQRNLIIAGKQHEWPLPQFLFTSLLSGAMMFVMFYFLLKGKDYNFVQHTALLVMFTLAGAGAPSFFLNIARKNRQKAIRQQLPECMDLLCVSVQAGLSFDGALMKITERMKGPLVDEFRRMQDDVRMGIVRRTALRSMAARCDVQDVSLFTTSIIQAERLGTSMGKTLKNQADNIRERHRQYVKAEAMKAPVKIIFPLVAFIFPAFFVVALMPAILSLMKNL